MKPRNAARVITVIGWLAGMILILAAWPLPAVLGALAVLAAAAFAALRWGPGWWTALKVTVQLRRVLKTVVRSVVKTGDGVVDRA